MSGITEKVIIEGAKLSPYPASFDGSTIRFQLALFAMLSLTVLGGMIWMWMCREIWKGRHDAYPWEPLFAIRLIFCLCSFQAMIRCGPEAAFMISYREGSVAFLAYIQFIKRWLDAASILPGALWMAGVWFFYIPICTQMVLMSRQAPVAPRVSPPQLRRMVAAIALTFMISALIAVGKR